MIENLSQLKKAIRNGACFRIVKHYVKPAYEGQIRKPNWVQTNGFYSVEVNKPDSDVSLANDGKGSWLEYGKASDWKFEEGLCKLILRGRPIWEIAVIEN